MTRAPKIIAIDGPAAAGKGTLARRLADHFHLELLDTGLLYRAVARKVLDNGIEVGEDPGVYEENAGQAARDLIAAELKVDGLRTDETAQAASKVSAIPAVRKALLDFQRTFANTPPHQAPGAVLDGRDIGTVVCPDADIKIFITASTEVRAERRHKELQERGEVSIYARVLQDMKERDARDTGRNVSPLAAAEDAFQIDTSDLDAEQVFAAALEFISSKNV